MICFNCCTYNSVPHSLNFSANFKQWSWSSIRLDFTDDVSIVLTHISVPLSLNVLLEIRLCRQIYTIMSNKRVASCGAGSEDLRSPPVFRESLCWSIFSYVCYVQCTMYCHISFVCYVQCTMYCHISFVCYVQCTMYCHISFVCYLQCTMYYHISFGLFLVLLPWRWLICG